MRSSCINWREDERLIVIRQSQLALCDGNHCAAALLSFFEHGHNYKLRQREQALHANRIAQQHGEEGKQDITLLQYQNEKGLEEGLLGLYGRKTIRGAIDILVHKGFLTIHANPNRRYHFDKTHYFLFHPDVVIAQLAEISDEVKTPHRGEHELSSAEDSLVPDFDKDYSQTIDNYDEVKTPRREGQNASWSGKNTSPSGKNAATRTYLTPELTDLDPSLSLSLSPGVPPSCQCARDTESITQMEAGFQPYTPGFELVCAAHPKQPIEGKKQAFGIWQAKKLEPRGPEIAQKLARLVVTKWKDRTHTPLLKTWLANGDYDDDLVPLESQSSRRHTLQM